MAEQQQQRKGGGPGRKRIPRGSGTERVQVLIRAPREIARAVDDLAEQSGRTANEVWLEAARGHLLRAEYERSAEK